VLSCSHSNGCDIQQFSNTRAIISRGRHFHVTRLLSFPSKSKGEILIDGSAFIMGRQFNGRQDTFYCVENLPGADYSGETILRDTGTENYQSNPSAVHNCACKKRFPWSKSSKATISPIYCSPQSCSFRDVDKIVKCCSVDEPSKQCCASFCSSLVTLHSVHSTVLSNLQSSSCLRNRHYMKDNLAH